MSTVVPDTPPAGGTSATRKGSAPCAAGAGKSSPGSRKNLSLPAGSCRTLHRMSRETILAKITDTFIGYEGHGIFSVSLQMDYGHSGQGFGHYHATIEIIEAIINACGVNSWEQVKGRTVYAVRDEGWGGLVRGLTPLPTERGTGFVIEPDGAVKPYA